MALWKNPFKQPEIASFYKAPGENEPVKLVGTEVNVPDDGCVPGSVLEDSYSGPLLGFNGDTTIVSKTTSVDDAPCESIRVWRRKAKQMFIIQPMALEPKIKEFMRLAVSDPRVEFPFIVVGAIGYDPVIGNYMTQVGHDQRFFNYVKDGFYQPKPEFSYVAHEAVAVSCAYLQQLRENSDPVALNPESTLTFKLKKSLADSGLFTAQEINDFLSANGLSLYLERDWA